MGNNMITIEQLKSEIEGISSNNIEMLHCIVQLLKSKANITDQPKLGVNNPLKGSITFENDIISPIDEHWEVDL